MKRFLLLTITAALMLSSGVARTHAQSNALGFFKNYFITGDYVVGGVGVHDTAGAGQLPVAGVPANADVSAAFLYWQVVANSNAGADAGSIGATFRGYPLSSTDGPFAKLLGAGTPPCWSNGGGTGSSGGSKATFTYRADVLRFLDVDPATGKLAANGLHSVTLPSSNSIEPLGASLVVIYRDPSKPLSAIVLYDGAYTMDQTTEGMFQRIEGFYDASTEAKMTHIVGSGQANKSERLYYNGALQATNPFQSALGAQWDNPTFTLTADPALRAVTTSVDHAGFNAFDCLTWSAIVYRTTVKDFDGDGLLDLWESSSTTLRDPNGQPLPPLNAMGAQPDRKDVFIEVGYLKSDAPTAYGGVVKPAHSHLPGHEALKLMGDAFATAPTGAVAVHFDVGNNYPAGPADPYIIRNGLARGGEAIDEATTVCTPGATDAPWVCQFAAYPGTVGWKSGYRFLRDELQVLNDPPPPTGVDCDAAGVNCERRFDRTRLQSFHYALFAHALGLPVSELPCLDAAGTPVADVNDRCTVAVNPAFRTPRTNTGVGDFPGGDALITLGGFADVNGLPVGTPFMQASTLMHEFGHNVERRHGGEAYEQNCKPTYLSTMNYLYQLRGLLDDTGTPHLDFSRGLGTTVDEQALPGVAYQPYRIGWYAPLAASYLAGRGTPARSHCNGSPLLPADPVMVRIDARTAGGLIDWDADNLAATTAVAQDVNFNGQRDGGVAALRGSEDWSALRLDQIGSRRNVGALYRIPGTTQFAVGPLSLDSGKGDLGKGDLGKGDLGKGDLGKGDLGKGDLGKGDLGKGDLGKGDLGKGDLGGGDLFAGDPNNPGGELDAIIAGDLARTPPNTFTACVIGETCASGTGGLHDVAAAWVTPNVGGVASYTLYRVPGDTLLAGQTWTQVATVTSVLGQTAYNVTDTAELVNGAFYTYFAVATYADGIASDPSNLVTITAFNDPPVAGNDSYTVNEDTTLTVAAPGVLGNDADSDSPVTLTTQLVSTTANGTLTLNANGSFVYVPNANVNGSDSFTYRASTGTTTSNVATVSITVNAVNDVPVISTIADVAIDAGGTTGPIAFTIGDADGLTGLTVSGTSSNLTLVPMANIVFGGTGANRTVTVTPAAGQSGAATVTIQVTDSTAASATSTFVLTVRAPVTFVGLQNIPPPAGKTFKTGSSVPLKWQYARGTTVVPSSQARFEVTVVGPLPNPTVNNTDSGQSSFRYATTDNSWSFNLQTKSPAGAAYPIGVYQVIVKSLTSGFPSSAPFTLTLTK